MASSSLSTLAVVLGVPLLAYPLLLRLLRPYLLKTYTCVPDLEQLGQPRPQGAKIRGTAVVCGGSFAGLFAARVCADHFERVVVVEPEAWTFTPEAREPPSFGVREVKGNSASYNTFDHKRSRVYQYTAVHLFQVLLLRFARKLFPGFDKIATAKQWGLLIRPGDINASLSGHFLRSPRPPAGSEWAVDSLSAPRRKLEPLVRKLVCEGWPDIEFVQGTASAFALAADGSISTVSVRLADGATQELECALAIDGTGISQSGFKLLSRALPPGSLPADLRASYNADIAYATLEYPTPPNFDADLRALNIPGYDTDAYPGVFTYNPSPEVDCRMVSLMRCQEGRVVFTMGGWAVDIPVTLDEIRAFAKGVRFQHHIPDYFFKAVDLLQPVAHLGTVHEARITNCYNIAYERAAHVLPRNFVALGDASMRVNPRFGQGVTKTAMGAITLDRVLRERAPTDAAFGKTFFALMAARTGGTWDGTRFADYAAETTKPAEGETRKSGAFVRWYNGMIFRVMEKNQAAASALWELLMFLAPPTDLFAPGIVASVLKEWALGAEEA